MDLQLDGKTVLVTGSSKGIGAGIAMKFALEGAIVLVHGRDRAQADEIAHAIVRQGGRAHVVLGDLLDDAAVARLLDSARQQAGPIDILVNNAANDDRHQLQDVTPAYWDERIAVNLRHQYFCAQAVAPAMRASGSGVILNLGSISWHLAQANLSIYMTAKAGIEGLTHGLARDLGADGIRVNCIIPGAVRTPRQERLWHTPEAEAVILQGQCLQTRVEPEDVAALALFLASDNAAKCTGREYFVDAGWYGA